MKKHLPIVLLFLLFSAQLTFSNEAKMLSINTILQRYGFKNGSYDPYDSRVYDVAYETFETVAAVEGDVYSLDTPEEFLTATYFSPIEIQAAQAQLRIQEVLPQDNPRQAGKRLGAMWYQKLVAYQFAVEDSPEKNEQVARYELIMNTISERTGATRAEMVATFRSGVREVIAEKVTEQFNRISFILNGGGKSFNCVLTREPNTGHYSLSYEGVTNGNIWTKELTAASLKALLAQMGRSSDFNQATIDVVREKAGIIPGVVYGRWVDFGMVVNPLELITEAITQFYLEPSDTNFRFLAMLSANYVIQAIRGHSEGVEAGDSLHSTIRSLNTSLGRRFGQAPIDYGGDTALACLSLPGNYSMLFNYEMYNAGETAR